MANEPESITTAVVRQKTSGMSYSGFRSTVTLLYNSAMTCHAIQYDGLQPNTDFYMTFRELEKTNLKCQQDAFMVSGCSRIILQWSVTFYQLNNYDL